MTWLALLWRNPLFRWIGAALAAAALFFGYGVLKRQEGVRDGAQRVSEEAARETVNKVERGNAAVNRGADPTERLRDNDDRWQ